MAQIIFICNANMCRSPMAEGILRKKCTDRCKDIAISSMGIHAMDDRMATDFAIRVCAEHGIDITGHISRPLIPEELKTSRLIFTMEPVQVDYIDLFFPQVSDRIYMLSTWPQRKAKKLAIADPVGKSVETYRKVFDKIESYIEGILPTVLSMSPNSATIS
jgi:protein arginine phosphatase